MALAASRKSLPVVLVLALSLVVVLPTASWAALNAYLKLDDCKGTLKVGAFTDLLPVTGFTSKVSNSATPPSGGGGGTGKAVAAPIQVLRDVDQCSPQIFLDVVTGKHLQQVTILFTRSTRNGKEQPFFKITLKDVIIGSVEATTTARSGTEDIRNIQEPTATEVNTGDAAALQEIVAFTFRTIELTDLVTNKTVSFDFAANEKI